MFFLYWFYKSSAKPEKRPDFIATAPTPPPAGQKSRDRSANRTEDPGNSSGIRQTGKLTTFDYLSPPKYLKRVIARPFHPPYFCKRIKPKAHD